MEVLDIFSREKVQLTSKNSNFKTKIGGFLTILQFFVVLIVAFLLAIRKFDNTIFSYKSDRANFKNMNNRFIISYPKKYDPFLKWFDINAFKLISPTTDVRPCTEQE